MALEAQNNPFTSVLFVGAADPEALPDADPSAGSYRLAVKTDGTLWIVDSTGTATAVTGSALTTLITTDTAWAAKGDLITGTANDTAAIKTVGANDTILMADSSAGGGVKWVASQTPSTQAFSDAAAEGTADTYARGDHKHAMPANPGGGGALVLLEQYTASASATLDFTTFISSTYDEYIFEGINIAPATDQTNILFRVGTGGGPTYDTSGNYYATSYTDFGASGGAAKTNADSGGTSAMLIKAISNAAGGYAQASFSFRFMSPNSTTVMKNWHGTGIHHDGSTTYVTRFGGLWGQTTAATAVRFLMSSGNIASGTIRVYGVAK